MRTYACPTPQRISHLNQKSAERQAINDRFTHGAHHQPYLCRCGAWHLTHNLAEELPTHGTGTPEDVDRLRDMSNTAFREVVDGDVKKTAPMRDRIALRHPDLNTRWRWALKALLKDVRGQLADRRQQDVWRGKAGAYEDAVACRLTECQAIRQLGSQAA